jgi:hypothetical protein
MDNQEERIKLQSVFVHNVPFGENENWKDYYFPVNHSLVRRLLGQILTQIEAMNLPQKTEEANKAIFIQMIWRWFDEVMDNSATSNPKAGLLPIKNPDHFSEVEE